MEINQLHSLYYEQNMCLCTSIYQSINLPVIHIAREQTSGGTCLDITKQVYATCINQSLSNQLSMPNDKGLS